MKFLLPIIFLFTLSTSAVSQDTSTQEKIFSARDKVMTALVHIQPVIPDILYTYMVLIITVLCPIFFCILCPPSGDIALRIIADQPVGSDGCTAQHPFTRCSQPG